MQKYIIRRLVLAIPTLLGLSLILFIMLRLIPGDIVALIAGDFGATDPAVREAIMEDFQLSDNPLEWPAHYVRWLGDAVRLDLGDSLISGRDVNGELATRLPVTMELGILAIIFAVTFGIPIGIISAVRQNSAADYTGRSVAIGLLAAPNFWIALVLIMAAGRWFRWGVPPTTYPALTEDPIANLKFVLVPALLLGASTMGSIMRFTRTSMLEVMRQDYIRTAWSKGLRERVVIVRHALRNALIPVVTIIGLAVPTIVGGSVIIESIYSIPGVGRYYISAINQHDFPIVQAIALLSAVVVVFANLAVDLTYSWLNPRIRYS